MAPDELPSGTVTLLFTDIEGSTRLVKQLRDGYGEVLADHRRLLRAAFHAHGGHEIDTQGDAFFVAFSRAKGAVAALRSRATPRAGWRLRRPLRRAHAVGRPVGDSSSMTVEPRGSNPMRR